MSNPMRYGDDDPRRHDLPGRIAYLQVMKWEADQISDALDGHMRAAPDSQTHGMLHRLRVVLHTFVDAMNLELPKCEAHLKAKAGPDV
jgi:hypothetical protein